MNRQATTRARPNPLIHRGRRDGRKYSSIADEPLKLSLPGGPIMIVALNSAGTCAHGPGARQRLPDRGTPWRTALWLSAASIAMLGGASSASAQTASCQVT